MAINNIHIIGNVGNDPKVHYFENSDKISIQFSVAVTDRWKDNAGAQKEDTTWVRCTRYTKNVDLAKYIRKGDKIYLAGKARTSAYIKDGVAVGVLEMLVDKIDFLSVKDNSNTPVPPSDVPPTKDDDDLPF